MAKKIQRKDGKYFSFVVPVRNGADTIALTLNSILSQTYKNFELIVVDNGSEDDTAKIVKTYDRVKYVYHSEPGRGRARNAGAKIARGDFLAFVDSDVVLDSRWLRCATEYLSSYRVDAVATRIMPVGENSSFTEKFRRAIVHSRTKGTFVSAQGPEGPSPLISPAACIVRKTVFDSLRGFDEKLVRNEDVDLSIRLFNSNYLIGTTSKAMAFDHYAPPLGSSLLKPGAYLYRTFQGRYYHYRPSRIQHIARTHLIQSTWAATGSLELLPLAILHQMSFNFGAMANWISNSRPLVVDFNLRKISPDKPLVLNYREKKCSMRPEIRLILLDHTPYYFLKDRRFRRFKPKDAEGILRILSGRRVSTAMAEHLIRSGLFLPK